MELTQVELAQAELAQVELAQVELIQVELTQVELIQVELTQVAVMGEGEMEMVIVDVVKKQAMAKETANKKYMYVKKHTHAFPF